MPNVGSANIVAEVAFLIGDAARANILSALMDGRALTAGELARHSGVTAQKTRGHLAKLAEAHLIELEKQGPHHYYRLASPQVAAAVQSLIAVAASIPKRYHPLRPKNAALRTARTCYDHLAGRLALALTDSLCARGHLLLADGSGIVTPQGVQFLADFGIVDLAIVGGSKRPLCRTCLDWSERRPHLAGQLGAAILNRLLELKWVVPVPGSRALKITRAGERGLADRFELPRDWQSSS